MFFFCQQNSSASCFQRCLLNCIHVGGSCSRNILYAESIVAQVLALWIQLAVSSVIITFLFITLTNSFLHDHLQCHSSSRKD